MMHKNDQAGGSGQTKTPYAVVVGLDSGTVGLQTARLLAQRQIPVIALARDAQNYCCRTRVCQKIITVDTRTEALIEKLVSLGPILDRPAVLIPCQDDSVLMISRHRERLTPWYRLVLPPPNIVDMMIDKSRFYAFAREHDLPIPQTFLLTDEASARTAAAGLRYPGIVKPENRSSAWTRRTHEKAFLVQDETGLMETWREWGSWGGSLIAQEWISGGDSDHFAFNGYFARDGSLQLGAISRKIRQWPPRTGQGCLSEPAEHPQIEKIARALFAAVPFCGLGYVEIKWDRLRDCGVIIEPNIGRPTGRSAGAEANGVPLLYALYCDALDRPIEAASSRPAAPVKWIHWRRDVLAAFYYWRAGELSLREWLRSWRGPKTSAIFSWTDPRPFVADWLRFATVFRGGGRRRVRPQRAPQR